MTTPETGLQLFSTVTDDGRLELALKPVPVPAPADDEVIIRVEATPINPSDLAVLLGVADTSQLSAKDGVTSAPIPEKLLFRVAGRKGAPAPVGNEGAGTVVAAGGSDAAQALLGKVVSLAGGQMYAQFKKAKARDCMVLPAGVSAAEGASSFVNPLTTLGMIGTMRREGYEALVHTAAASNLGQMLVKLCQAEGVALVNVVRQLSLAYGERGITAHLVAPGPADTERLRRVAADRARLNGTTVEAVLTSMKGESSLHAFTEPGQVAWALEMLLAPEASAMTGSSRMLDAGRRRGLP